MTSLSALQDWKSNALRLCKARLLQCFLYRPDHDGRAVGNPVLHEMEVPVNSKTLALYVAGACLSFVIGVIVAVSIIAAIGFLIGG